MEKNKKMKILLIFPPFWMTIQPYLSLPALKAYLEREEHEVITLDLSLVLEDWILHDNNLDIFFEFIEPIIQDIFSKNTTTYFLGGKKQILTLSKFINQEYISLSQTKIAKSFLRKKENYYKTQKTPFNINYCLTICYNFFKRLNLYFSYYFSPQYDLYKSEDLLSFSQDYHRNLLLHIVEKFMLENIIRLKPDIIGLSLIFQGQLTSTFTLASLLKKNLPSSHITVGGPYLTQILSRNLKKLSNLFKIIDSIILGEGEIPLSKLASSLSEKNGLKQVPNLVFFKENEVIINNPPDKDINLDDLPTPDYEGLPLHRYLSAFPILSLQTSRSCYWGKCCFCNATIPTNRNYRVRSPKLVVNDLLVLKEKFKDAVFHFADDATSPKQCKNISKLILEKGLDIRWFTEIRGEPLFNKDLCNLMYKAGARSVRIGLESINEKTLKLMNKGIKLNNCIEVIRNFAQTGFLVHIFLMAFPGETMEDLMKMHDFVEKNLDIIHFFSFNEATQLFVNTPMWNDPEKFSLNIISHERDLCTFDEYTYSGEDLNYSQRLKIKEEFDWLLERTKIVVKELSLASVLHSIGVTNYLVKS